MKMGGIVAGVLLLFQILSVTGAMDGHFVRLGDSPVTCSSEGVECDNSGDNLIDVVFGVLTLEECRQLCLDDVHCNFISYFGDLATPISHLCQMFTTCDDTTNSTNVISENMKCYRSCGSNVVGDLNENIQDILTVIESESSCRESCLNVPQCAFYTYFYPNDTQFENYCILQTEFVGPAQPCNTCISAPVDCPIAKCSLALDGEDLTVESISNGAQQVSILNLIILDKVAMMVVIVMVIEVCW